MVSSRTLFLDLVSGRKRGLVSDLARGGLSLLAVFYRVILAIRNGYYIWLRAGGRRMPCPVISVGNLTVGGTGKTPLSALLAEMLRKRGRRVAVLTRGYKGRAIQVDAERRDAAMGQWRRESDEALVLKQRCPNAIIVINPDRVTGARAALSQGADVLILDDGFQHRRLARDLDIVLIDATAPFGHGRLLPRGLLREPEKALRRADLIVLTRSDQIESSDRTLLVAQLRRTSGGRPVLSAIHRIRGFLDLKGRPVPIEDASAMQAVIFAGIANFGSFRRCVEALDVHVLAAYEYPDHHDYTAEEIAALGDVASNLEANVILTTEKDAVKLVGRWEGQACRLLVPRLEIEFQGEGDTILNQMLTQVLEAEPLVPRA
ncbi:MAG: tetraacyldisaccharide 4'-kinase [Phycisphaerae bacterium]